MDYAALSARDNKMHGMPITYGDTWSKVATSACDVSVAELRRDKGGVLSWRDRKLNPRPRCSAWCCKLCISLFCRLQDYIETLSVVVDRKPYPTIISIPYIN